MLVPGVVRGRVDSSLKVSDQLVLTLLLHPGKGIMHWPVQEKKRRNSLFGAKLYSYAVTYYNVFLYF